MRLMAAAAAALLLVPSLVLAQAAPALDGRLKKIRDAKTITVAYRTDAAPFSFEDANKHMAGFSIDLCRRVVGAIEKQLGVSLQTRWVPVTVQNRFDTIAKGDADMECG